MASLVERFWGWVSGNPGEQTLKSISASYAVDSDQFDHIAEEQGAVVNPAFAMMDANYGTAIRKGISDKTGATYGMLRAWVAACPCVSAIIRTRTEQVASFCKPVETRWGFATKPGFRVRLRRRSKAPTPAEQAEIEMWEHFFEDGGFCPPPINERPIGWQPGLEYIVRCLTRDSLILDNAAIRLWSDKNDPKKFPVVAFAPEDGSLIRRTRRTATEVKDGKIVAEAFESERENTKREIVFAKLMPNGNGVTEQFTENELAIWSRNPRTDSCLQGHGVSESEMAVSCLADLLATGEYNSSRFKRDSIPRGMLVLKGNVDEKQLAQFRLNWVQNLRGLANRWNFPIIKTPPGDGGGVEFLTMDTVPRDMEYSQLRYNLITDVHAIFGMHPEESGYAATSPYAAPMSEASPEVRLKHSQDNGLDPILRSLAAFFNTNILWRADTERKFVFEWLGLGDENAMEDEQLVQLMFANGTLTPREYYEARDKQPPSIFANHPVLDLPMPIAQGLAYIESQRQSSIADEQRERQESMEDMQMQQQQEAQAQQMQRMQGMQGQGIPQDAPPQGMAPQGAQNPSGGSLHGADPYGGSPGQPDGKTGQPEGAPQPTNGERMAMMNGATNEPAPQGERVEEPAPYNESTPGKNRTAKGVVTGDRSTQKRLVRIGRGRNIASPKAFEMM